MNQKVYMTDQEFTARVALRTSCENLAHNLQKRKSV